MSLPVNIKELINGRTVEWERIEFKKGWNPESVLHSICAFANDFNNWGGGYIILGIEEKDGLPVLPPTGLEIGYIDRIQKELHGLCNLLYPPYFPVVEPVYFQKRHILIIWVPGGQNRPYKAPISLGKRNEYAYYIRRFSKTVKARGDDEKELLSMTASIPFDDRISHNASINDLNLTLIKAHLRKVGSDLLLEADTISFADLCRRMNIAEGPDEYLRPKNAGLLFFNDEPHRFFKGAQIDIVEFRDEGGDSFTERIFTGPLRQQIVSVLAYLKNNILAETIRKVPDKAEAIRFFNYPYQAVEESLVNAVYHKSYEIAEPVEIRITPDRIEILSYPGPLPPLNKDNLMDANISSRRYRNRIIGNLLKELRLTEGRNTGFRKIRKALKTNGSPEPVFKTDEERSYFITVLKIHPEAQVEAQVEAKIALNDTQIKILSECAKNPLSKKEIAQMLGHSEVSGSIKLSMEKLIKHGLLDYTIPEKPRSRFQKYRATSLGRKIIE